MAWAAGDSTRWWWPTAPYYWPEELRRGTDLDAFIDLFVQLGFGLASSGSGSREDERIAVFANDFGVTHVARELDHVAWTSKLDGSFDIRHSLEALEGGVYGRVVALLSRPRRSGP